MIAHGYALGSRQQDSAPAADVPFRAGQNCRLPAALSSALVGRVVSSPHPGAAWDEPTAEQSEASIPRQAVAAVRKAAAWPSAPDGREISRAYSGYAETALSIHGHRRLYAHSRAESLRRVQSGNGDSLYRRSDPSAAVPYPRGADRQWLGIPITLSLARSHRVDDQEFYQLLDQDGISDDIHLFNEKLREWDYNYHRPHGAVAGQTPYERLIAKMRAGTSPAS
jgi:hypothetical protein